MHLLPFIGLAAALPLIAACGASSGGAGGGVAGTLPITANGQMIALELASTVTTAPAAGGGVFLNTPLQGTAVLDQTPAGGVGISGNAVVDPAGTTNGTPATGQTVGALVTASATANLAGGKVINPINDGAGGGAPGRVYFENGNFGDPQVETSTGAISAVSVYNPNAGGQISLSDVTTIRYRGGASGDTSAVYGVGFIGNPTAAMPANGQVTYRSFLEGGQGKYNDGGTLRDIYFDSNRTVQIIADFGAGTVTGGVSASQLRGDNGSGNTQAVLNPNITGMAINGTITGSDFTGTVGFVDGAGVAQGGAPVVNELIGGFFGTGAKNAAAAFNLVGTADLDGNPMTDFVFTGVLGGIAP